MAVTVDKPSPDLTATAVLVTATAFDAEKAGVSLH